MGIFGIIAILAIRPLPPASWDNSRKVEGTISRVFEGGGEADIVFQLATDHNYYYINRGTEHGLVTDTLSHALTDQQVVVYYIDQWSILDPSNTSRHVSRLVYADSVVYNEIPED